MWRYASLFCKSRVFDLSRLVYASICPTQSPTGCPLICTIAYKWKLIIVLASTGRSWCALITRQGPRTLPSRGRNRQIKHPSCIFHTNEANDSLGANPRPINMRRPSEIALWMPAPKTTSLRADDMSSRTGVTPANFMTLVEKKAVREAQNLLNPKAIEPTPTVPKQTPTLPRQTPRPAIQTPKLPEPTTKPLEPTAKSNPPKPTPKETYGSTGSTQFYKPSRTIEGVSSAEAKRNAITARRNKYKYHA